MDCVKKKMAEKGLTTEALAIKANIKKRTLDPYMSGKSKWKNARGQVLLAVADALELDPHDMVDDSNKRAQTK